MRQEPRSDGDLLTAVADRDREALRELYDRHAPWLRARLARRCGDEGVVEEVLQDTFLAVWRTPTGYRGTGDVAAWLWGIGIRRLLAAVRARRPGALRRAPPAPPSRCGCWPPRRCRRPRTRSCSRSSTGPWPPPSTDCPRS